MAIPSSSRMSWMNRAMSSVSSRFMPATGSSRRSNSGSIASARPSSTRFWNPYGSSDTGCLRHCSISRKSMMSSTRRRFSSSSRLAGPHQIAPASHERCIRTWRPVSRLSITVIPGNSSMFWNVRAIPRPATTSGRRPRIDSPFQRMSPVCGRYTWLIVLKIDVLPAPLGPMMANSSPGCTENETSLIASTPPNRNPISSTTSNGSVMAFPGHAGRCWPLARWRSLARTGEMIRHRTS